jgi:tripartite-type tricarboxylate transporter receptor subunit TctC
VWAPARTPEPVVARLNAEITRAALGPLAGKLAAAGIEVEKPHTAADMAAYIKAQSPKWAKLVKDSGAKGD